MTDETVDDPTIARSDDPAIARSHDPAPSVELPPQYGLGPFSIREVVLGGIWLVAFAVSFFPVNLVDGPARALIGGANLWVSGLSWILAIGLPTVAVFLIVLRRLSPQGIRRVGSLGIDQFASVAFSVAAVVWVTWVWETVAVALDLGLWTRSWVVWVEAVLMVAGVVLTVVAPLIPGVEQDFQGRPESTAHRNAREVRAVSKRPVRERPVAVPADEAAVHAPHDTGARPPYAPAADEPRADAEPFASTSADLSATDVFAPLSDDRAGESSTPEWAPSDDAATAAPPVQQAFWALAPEERDVVDEYGAPLFRIGPTAWALVIEDRGAAFVVRDEDGRVGFLHDVSGVTRG